MKADLDSLMQAHQIEAILITGSAQHNPAMVYMTGGAHMTGDLLKPCGREAILFCNPMERDEAARTGLFTKSLADYNFQELLKETDHNYALATAMRYQKMLSEHGVTAGRVALYGQQDTGVSFAVFTALQKLMPELELVGESGDSLLMRAMETKDDQEVARIRKMGQITTQVVGRVADFLTSHQAKNDLLIQANGEPLTISDVKSRIDLWLAELGAENPEGTIFAIGRDAGVPHSSGTASDPLRLGQTIVFDIFPCEKGGGYYYDFTRTWCLGYAPDGVQKLYDDVRFVYDQVMGELKVDTDCSTYQKLTCDLFEARGHLTIQNTPNTQEGYVHSLGHGVGLHVHERPWFRAGMPEVNQVVAGAVFTVEPGLYYPERGMGVRLEDTVWARPDGSLEVLAPFPLDLVIPVKQG